MRFPLLLCGLLLLQAPLPVRLDAQTSPPAAAVVRSADSTFGRLVAELSEPGAYFDTDNLISNETSYLHPIGALRRLGLEGGAYVGVGPDQNFAYIAALRPRIAFIVDIRRDNLLHHLLLRSLFTLARNRVEYLALLFGRPAPPDVESWNRRDIEALVGYIDRTPVDTARAAERRARILATAAGFGVPLSAGDLATIARFHTAFVSAGLDLRFASHGREPRPYYPTYRQLLLERDRSGRPAGFLVTERDFQFVRSLEVRGLVVPVVGDLAGDHAVRAIGRELVRRGERLSAIYTSNVEYYLMQDGRFDRFAANLRTLPYAENAVLVRSYFPGRYGAHPAVVPGYFSAQLVQPLARFHDGVSRGAFPTYWELVTKDLLELE